MFKVLVNYQAGNDDWASDLDLRNMVPLTYATLAERKAYLIKLQKEGESERPQSRVQKNTGNYNGASKHQFELDIQNLGIVSEIP